MTALHGVIAIDSDRCDIQCQNTCFKWFPCWLNQQFFTMISGGVLLQAPPTYHIQMHALDGYVFILHGSVDFSQICGESGGIYLRKRTDITIYPVVVMPCTHCLKYIYTYVQLCKSSGSHSQLVSGSVDIMSSYLLPLWVSLLLLRLHCSCFLVSTLKW